MSCEKEFGEFLFQMKCCRFLKHNLPCLSQAILLTPSPTEQFEKERWTFVEVWSNVCLFREFIHCLSGILII